MSLRRFSTISRAEKLADELVEFIRLEPFLYDAFASVQRECFVPDGLKKHAYSLDALPLASNQWISSPLTVAKMTSALELDGVDSVLEIGCGSGYQAAILSKIVRRVFTIERIEKLLKEAKSRFKELNMANIHTRFDDGQRGWRAYAPYDRILFSASAKQIPDAIFSQLKDGGLLVAPIDKGKEQIITSFFKKDNEIIKTELDSCVFVPVVDGLEK